MTICTWQGGMAAGLRFWQFSVAAKLFNNFRCPCSSSRSLDLTQTRNPAHQTAMAHGKCSLSESCRLLAAGDFRARGLKGSGVRNYQELSERNWPAWMDCDRQHLSTFPVGLPESRPVLLKVLFSNLKATNCLELSLKAILPQDV